jgi:DNA-binding NarL/FixJ family response regulator
MSNTIQIILVDDHPMVLTGLSAIIQVIPSLEVVGQFLSAKDALQFLETNSVDLVITDIHLPEIDGIALCKQVHQQYPKVKIIAMSTFEDRSYISSMIEQGAHGYAGKSTSPEELKEVIDQVMIGEICIKVSGGYAPIHQPSSSPVLTRREKEVLQCLAQGLINKEIATQLFISQHTVDSHRKNLLMKFNVQNTAALIASAAKLGWV